jgi:hypothetical protein
MDEKTLSALKGSIAKWESIVAGTATDKGTTNCPLCHLFHSDYGPVGGYCKGCPVFEATGQRECWGTPYHAYRYDRTTANAQKELNFLKSLLPTAAQS